MPFEATYTTFHQYIGNAYDGEGTLLAKSKSQVHFFPAKEFSF